MPIFVDQTTGNVALGMDGNMMPGEDTASQNVLMEKILGGKKFVHLLTFSMMIVCVDWLIRLESSNLLKIKTNSRS